jgi:predicted DNA-binding antitoxin AbrB/MazE fold protein
MGKTIKALFEDGVFKPLKRVHLKNRQRVNLTVVESEKPTKRLTKSTAKRRTAVGRGSTAHPAYRIVALFKSGTHDLASRHDHYLYR